MICLDPNVAVSVMHKSSTGVAARFADVTARETVFLSTVALFELKFGIANSLRPDEYIKKLDIFLGFSVTVLPFTTLDAQEAADIRADPKRRGTPICSREFARAPRLALLDWTTAE